MSKALRTAGRLAVVYAAILVVAGFELWIAWLALHPQVSEDYRSYFIDQTTTCLNKPVAGGYVLGSTVSFMPDDQPGARRLRVCGWDGPAGDGTHSVGTTSRLRFGINEPVDDLVLRLEMTAALPTDLRTQRIVVSGNGVLLGEATIAAGETESYDFRVPAAAIEKVYGRLDVILSYPNAAEMTPNDSNTHYRAIKLRSVQLRRPEDPPSSGTTYDESPESQN